MRGRAQLTIIAAIAPLLLVPGCGGDDEEQVADLPEGCAEVEQPAPKAVDLQAPGEGAPRPATATVETSCGAFEIALDAQRAPRTVASFAHMAEQGLYDGTPFHRIAPGFVIQGGDPAGDGTGGPGYFVDEAPPANLTYARGLVAMAKSPAEPPGRSGSQFFVVVAPADAGLPPEDALLGRVSEGMDVVERIESLGLAGGDGPPRSPVIIERVTIGSG